MSSMYWKWGNFSQFNFSQFDFSKLSKLNGGSIYIHMHSSVDISLDIDRPAGEPEVGVCLA